MGLADRRAIGLPRWMNLVGFFPSTRGCLRVGVNSAHRFSEVLEQVRTRRLDCLQQFRMCPFERLVEQPQPRLRLHVAIIRCFKVLMVLSEQCATPRWVAFDEVSVEPAGPASTRTAKFDLGYPG